MIKQLHILNFLGRLLSVVFVLIIIPFTANSAVLSRIQKGTTTMAAGSGTVNQTISTVNLSRSFLVYSISINSSQPGESQIAGRLASSDRLTFDRFDVGGTPNATIYWQVFEFSSGVNVQRGSITDLAAGGANISLSSVNTSRSFATANMRKDGGQYGTDDFITANITSSTNLYIDRQGGGANPQNVYWQVIEWTGASVQKIVTNLNAGTDSLAVTLGTTVNKNKTMVIGNHQSDGNLNADDFPCTELVNGNTVSFSRTGTGRTLSFVCYVVEFSDNTDVIHGAIRMTTAQNNISTTICSVSTTNSGIIPPNNYFRSGTNCENGDDDMGIANAAFELTSSTSVRAVRGTTGAAGLYPFQVLEFTATTPAGCTPPEPGASTPRTIGLCGAALPIELLDFDAQQLGDAVGVSWITASEINNDYFVVERSSNGLLFDEIGTIQGAGNSSETINYGMADRSPLTGISYYRLKQVDFDGAFTYSQIESVSFSSENNTYVIYPNPTTGSVLIKGVAPGSQVVVYNPLGQQLQPPVMTNGSQYSIDLSAYPRGIYYIKINGEVQQLILQ